MKYNMIGATSLGTHTTDTGASGTAKAVCMPYEQTIRQCTERYVRERQASQEANVYACQKKLSNHWRKLSDSAFVNRLYDSILDRTPDAGGRRHWQSRLKSGYSRDGAIKWFFKSPEYKSRRKSNRDFIIDSYQVMYSCNPSEREISLGLSKLSQAGSREGYLAARFPSTANRASNTQSCGTTSKLCRSLFMKGQLNLTKSEKAKYADCSRKEEVIKACKKRRGY